MSIGLNGLMQLIVNSINRVCLKKNRIVNDEFSYVKVV